MRQRGAAMGAEFKGKGGEYIPISLALNIAHAGVLPLCSTCCFGTYDELDESAQCGTQLGRVSVCGEERHYS